MKGLIAVVAAAWGLAATLVLACRGVPAQWQKASERAAAMTASGADDRNIVLITLDGVRWQEVFRGVDPGLARLSGLPEGAVEDARRLLPGIHRLFFEGGTALGDPRRRGGISASASPYISMPGYLELLTGATSACRQNDCTPSLTRTLADDVGRLPSIEAREEVAVFASWESLERAAAVAPGAPGAAPRGVFVDAGRGAGDGTPAWPGVAGYRPDRATAAAAIAHLRKHRPRFLWVSLGDTDEWAHRGDYRGYLDALRFADRFIEEVTQHLGEMGRYGERTVVMVTTDHGRDESFAHHGSATSAAVWLLARGGGLPAQGAIGTRRPRFLRDVAPTARALLGLPQQGCEGCGEVIEELLPPG